MKCLFTDPNGRLVIAKIKVSDEELFLASVYAPCDLQNQSIFIQNLSSYIVSKTNTSKLIIAGDSNTTLHSIDKHGGRPWHETSYRNSLLNFMDELGLVDAYRVQHSKKKNFTYESKSLKLKSRIDFFLIAQSLKLNIRKAEIRASIAPDHKAIFLSIAINDAFQRGPGTWKFNNQLLEDENYVQLISECFPRILLKYQEVESHQLLWELIKMELRTETITYSKANRKELKNRETVLQTKIDALDNKICHENEHFNQTLLDEYESIKIELKEIYEKRGQEAMFRSKTRWIEKGEKPTNYFFNLEKRNYEKKVIAQLKLENGVIISDMKQINKEIESFYSNLLETNLSNPDDFNEDFNAFVEDIDTPQLSPEESMALESNLTLDELKKCFEIVSKQQIPW